tara:strand:+ start:10207 stop:11232 length:1026 start_codon:yes stop_codon:yes gene_type:complete
MFGKRGKINLIIDGQFGSCGKGLVSSYFSPQIGEALHCSTNGANSGHTSYLSDKKVILHHLPTSAIHRYAKDDVYIGPGSVINPKQLADEIAEHANRIGTIVISPYIAVITQADIDAEADIAKSRGSTASGTGAAFTRKIMRRYDELPYRQLLAEWGKIGFSHANYDTKFDEVDWSVTLDRMPALMEVAQGFGLSLNSSHYPYCTSRDVTPAQALSDIGAHPSALGDVCMVIRTYPIRVGGKSGPFFEDSIEIDFDKIQQEEELTTVTQKVRRIATFSYYQFERAVKKIQPNYLFVNFMNYFQSTAQEQGFLRSLDLGRFDEVYLGYGPTRKDVKKWRDTK